MDVNEWTAKECGITEWKYEQTNCDGNGLALTFTGYKTENFKCHDAWTMEDARCREIVRERFKLDSVCHNSMFECYYYHDGSGEMTSTEGKSFEAAELSCIQAIYEQRDK